MNHLFSTHYMGQKKKILITWGLWYIGSHTATVFIENWYDVIIVDNLSNSHESALEWIKAITWKTPKFYELDLRNYSDLDAIFDKHANDIALVIHLAAKKAVWESCQDPFLYYDHNILGTINLLKVMNKHHINQIIFSSSATVYDAENLLPPFSETDKTKTTNPYGTTKLVIENLLRDMVMQKWFSAVALRYFNPIWAHPSHILWENPKWIPTNLLPFLLKVAKWEIEKLNVFGNDYDTEDWTCIRDYIHVMDVAEAHFSAAKYLFDRIEINETSEMYTAEPTFEICNIWTWYGKSVAEMIWIVETLVDKEIPYEIVARRPWDVAVSLANPLKAKQLLNWEAKRTVVQWVEDAWLYLNNEKRK